MMATNQTRVIHPGGTVSIFHGIQSYKIHDGALQITERINTYTQDLRVTLIPWLAIEKVIIE